MTKSNINTIIGGGLVGGFVATIIFAIDAHNKLNKVAAKLDLAVDEMIDANKIDIPTDMIERSVLKVAERRYDSAIKNACDDAILNVRNDFDYKINTVVTDEFNNQKTEVAKEMKRKINSIDINSIRKEVVEEAKETAAEKFKSDLDDILKAHNDELESVSKIYESIAQKLGGN